MTNQHRFGIERRCTCRKNDRTAECVGGEDYHEVWTHEYLGPALREASELQLETDVRYRVVDKKTGAIL